MESPSAVSGSWEPALTAVVLSSGAPQMRPPLAVPYVVSVCVKRPPGGRQQASLGRSASQYLALCLLA